MKTTKIQKAALWALVLGAVFLAACSSGGDSGGERLVSLTVGAQVYDNAGEELKKNDTWDFGYFWDGSGFAQLTSYFDNTEVQVTDGKLTLSLGALRNPSILADPAAVLQGWGGVTGTVSSDAKILPVFKFENSGNISLHQSDGAPQPEDTVKVVYIYADKDVYISGAAEAAGITVDLDLKKGWNTVLVSYIRPTVTVKTGTPASSWWYVR